MPGLHGGGLAAAALVGGSLLVLLYLFVIVELIQRTSSVFSSVLSNLKIVLAIGGAELLVQNTRLPAVSWVGVVIVTVSFGVMVRAACVRHDPAGDGEDLCFSFFHHSGRVTGTPGVGTRNGAKARR